MMIIVVRRCTVVVRIRGINVCICFFVYFYYYLFVLFIVNNKRQKPDEFAASPPKSQLHRRSVELNSQRPTYGRCHVQRERKKKTKQLREELMQLSSTTTNDNDDVKIMQDAKDYIEQTLQRCVCWLFIFIIILVYADYPMIFYIRRWTRFRIKNRRKIKMKHLIQQNVRVCLHLLIVFVIKYYYYVCFFVAIRHEEEEDDDSASIAADKSKKRVVRTTKSSNVKEAVVMMTRSSRKKAEKSTVTVCVCALCFINFMISFLVTTTKQT
jgi:Ca2+/Na+ antiporter